MNSLVVTSTENQIVETPPYALRFTPKSNNKLKFDDETFDEVFCVCDVQNIHEECFRVLKIGGTIKSAHSEIDLIFSGFEEIYTENNFICGKKLKPQKDMFSLDLESRPNVNFFTILDSENNEFQDLEVEILPETFVNISLEEDEAVVQSSKRMKNNSGEKIIEEREPVTFEQKKIQSIKNVDYYIAYCGQPFKPSGKELKSSKQCMELHGGTPGTYCYGSRRYKCLVCGSIGTHKQMNEKHPHFELDHVATVETEGDQSHLVVSMKKFPKPAKVFNLLFKQNNESVTKLTHPKNPNYRVSKDKPEENKTVETEKFPTLKLDPSKSIRVEVEVEIKKNEVEQGNVHPNELKLKKK
jgi:5-methylcytosine-specific restriction endonuclease McrA